MIGNESCDFLRENDHRYNEHEGRPKQHGAQVIPFHRAQGCAALLPESNSQQYDGKPQEQGPKSLYKRARSRRPERACEPQGKTAPYRCERADNRAQGSGDDGPLLHPFSFLRGLHFVFSRVHFFLAYFSEASILFLNSLALAITAGSSTVSSFLSRITTRPPMITVSTSLPFNAYANCAYTSYIGTAFGASRPMRIKSAFFPVSSEPISFSTCSARAPSMVAISTTAFAPSACGSILVIF